MEIVKSNGEIIRLSVQEYKELGMSRQEFIQVYRNEVETTPKQVNKKFVGTLKHRVSSGKHWKKYEDKILLTNSVDKAIKLLPNRTRIAIYARRSHLNIRGNKKSHRRLINPNDKRINMMRTVNKIVGDLRKAYPKGDLVELRKMAFKIYKTK